MVESSVVVIDDVISAGSTAYECIQQLGRRGIKCAAWVVAMNREEPGPDSSLSAAEWLRAETGVPVIALLSLADIVDFAGI